MPGKSPQKKKQPQMISLDEIIPIIHSTVKDAIGSVEVEVYNGGDVLVKKSPWTAMTAISQDVREVRNNVSSIDSRLIKAEVETKENSELLEDKKQRKVAITNLISLIKNLSIWNKIAIGAFIIHYGYILITSTDIGKHIGTFFNSLIQNFSGQ